MLATILLLATLAGGARRAACDPPAVGDWVVDADCTLVGQHAVTGNVTVLPGVTLALAPGAALDVDFAGKHLRVRQGARVIVQLGAKLH